MWYYYWLAVKKTFVFTGRATPKEWWGFYLAALILLAIITAVLTLLHFITIYLGIHIPSLNIARSHPWVTLGIVNYILIAPIVSITFRRLQDTNVSAWPLVAIFITIILFFTFKLPLKNPLGLILWTTIGAGYIYYIFYRLCIPGTKGPNKYGPPSNADKVKEHSSPGSSTKNG
jgi:uncharacterized membrane protein YhaH (DUF805 family)